MIRSNQTVTEDHGALSVPTLILFRAAQRSEFASLRSRVGGRL